MAILQHQEHLIPSAFGRQMAADLWYSVGNTKLVIYAHGINGFKDWGGMDLIAQAFANEGFSFLKFNFSHNGTTPEEPTSFVDLEAYGADNYSIRQSDLKQVFNYILTGGLPVEVQNITLIGHSRGGVDALIYASSNSNLDQLVTWAAPNNAKTPWSRWSKKDIEAWHNDGVRYLKNGRTGQDLPLNYQLYEDYLANADRYNAEACAAQVTVPWLILHGDQDETVSAEQGQDLKNWSRRSRLKIIKGAGHTFGRIHPWEESELPTESKTLVRATLDFLVR